MARARRPRTTDERRRAIASRRAFTLIEMAVVIGISAIIAALAYTGMSQLRTRADRSNALRGIESLLRQARSEAFGRGASVVFFGHPTADGYEYGALVDPQDQFNPADITASLLPTDVMLDREILPTGVALRDSTSPVVSEALPAPFDHVPVGAPCTFCDDGNGLVVVFHSDGTAALGVTPTDHPLGGVVFLVALDPSDPTQDQSRALAHVALAILSPTGTIASFDR